MKIRLHKPKQGLWNVALVLFILGLLGSYISIPVISGLASLLILASAAILLLGTWLI